MVVSANSAQTTVVCTGTICADNVAYAARILRETLARCSAPEFIVDLEQLSYLDSAALGLLAEIAAELRASGRALVIRNAAPFIARILKLSSLVRLMEVVEPESSSHMIPAVRAIPRREAGK